MARIRATHLESGATEGLAGTGGGPEANAGFDSGKLESERPPGDAGEEMALGVSVKIRHRHLSDGTRVDMAGRDESVRDQLTEPRAHIFIVVIIVVQSRAML